LRFWARTHTSDSGIALILVMLAVLVLSVLAAAIVFTGRSESLAAYSFKLDAQADYVAKAGIENAVNWLRSNHYAAVSQAQMLTTLYYNVTAEPKYGLYSSNNTPIQCVASSPSCLSPSSTVQLIGYGSGSSNYPNINNGLGFAVRTAFANDLNNNGNGVRVTGDSDHAGLFWVNLYLLNYQTVTCSSCAQSPAPLETWLVTAKGVWTGGSTQTGAVATAEEQAIVQPVYYQNFGNALYGYCSVSLAGSAGTCTDAYNSALGAYGGGNVSVASGACDQTVINVIASDSNVGANGYVSIGNNPTVAGNVVIGNANPSLIPSSCCTGNNCSAPSSGNVKGSIITGAPYVYPPAVPTFPANFPATAPSYSSAITLPQVSSSNNTAPTAPTTTINAGNSTYAWPCYTSGLTCNGSKSNPYLISSISSNSDTFTFYGGPDVSHPVYYDIDSITLGGNNSMIAVSGYVVFNVQTSIDIKGQGVSNSPTTAPEALQINYAGTSGVSLHGNAAMTALLTAPLATVTLGGGGSSGYFVGSIRALNVSAQGGYPMHFDVQLSRLDGTVGQMIVSSFTRIKQ
jgi:Tfp pilus assembly protein PilV